MQRMYLWWSLCTLYLHAFQVRVTIGDSGLFTRVPGESHHRWLRSLLLYLCYVFQVLINSLVCWFCMSTLGFVPFQICIKFTNRLSWATICGMGKKGHHVSHCTSHATWLLKCSGQGVRLRPPEKKYPEAAAVVSLDSCNIRQCLAVRPIQQTVTPGTCFLNLICKSPGLNYSIKLVF